MSAPVASGWSGRRVGLAPTGKAPPCHGAGGEGALEIRVLHRHGKGIREIAREMGSSRNTVRRYLRDESAARYKPRRPRATKLDPFKNYVVERLIAAAPERIPASVLLRELRERGYTGGYTMLKALVAAHKPNELAA